MQLLTIKLFIVANAKESAKIIAYSRYDDIFAPNNVTERISEGAIKNLKSNVEEGNSQKEATKKMEETFHAEAKKPLPLVEKFPVHYYTDGIKPLEMVLGFKAKVAAEHVRGNQNYTMYDAVLSFSQHV